MNQEFCGSYEILAVDNNSDDETPDVIEDFEHRFPDRIRGLECRQQGSYAARNTGIHEASSEILCFIDADMYAPKNYLQLVKNYMSDPEKRYVGCEVTITCKINPSISARYNAMFDFDTEKNLRKHHFVETCCLITRMEIFRRLGLFDQRFISNGDLEFGQRVHQADVKQWYADHIDLYHPARETVRSLSKRKFRIGRGKYQMRIYHPEYGKGSSFLEKLKQVPPNPVIIQKKYYARWSPNPVMFFMIYTLRTYLKFVEAAGLAFEMLRESVGSPE